MLLLFRVTGIQRVLSKIKGMLVRYTPYTQFEYITLIYNNKEVVHNLNISALRNWSRCISVYLRPAYSIAKHHSKPWNPFPVYDPQKH